MTTIEDELKKIPASKREYFKWKHQIFYFDKSNNKTEKEFLKYVGKKTLAGFKRWERTEQYKKLVCILLQAKTANDLLDIYNSVAEKARAGDSRAIETYLKLERHINNILKESNNKKKDEDESDGLEV